LQKEFEHWALSRPGSYAEFAKATKIKEATQTPPKAEDMVKILSEDHERVAKTIRPVLADANKVNDDVSADVLTQRISVHEKTAWMLRSMI
jgi:starvation-inducible DNA-binding protein